jgi:hypothetical protein
MLGLGNFQWHQLGGPALGIGAPLEDTDDAFLGASCFETRGR